MDRDELRQRFREAAYALRRMPVPKNGLPAGFKTSWPDVAYEWLAYGWTPVRLPRILPSPREITRLDEVLGWLHWLSREQRVILWARARGWTWRQVEAIDEMERDGHGRQEQWLRTIRDDGEARILAKLNGTPRRMVIDAKGLGRAAGEGKGVLARGVPARAVQAIPGALERV